MVYTTMAREELSLSQHNDLVSDIQQRLEQMSAVYKNELVNALDLLLYTAEQSAKHANVHTPREVTDVKDRVIKLWKGVMDEYLTALMCLNTQLDRDTLLRVAPALVNIKRSAFRTKRMNRQLYKDVQITPKTSEYAALFIACHLYVHGEHAPIRNAHAASLGDVGFGNVPEHPTDEQMLQLAHSMVNSFSGTDPDEVERWRRYGARVRKKLIPVMKHHAIQRVKRIKQIIQACDWLLKQLRGIAKTG